MNFIVDATIKAAKLLYQTDITAADVTLQQTRKEFEGQVTIVTFPFVKFSRKSPEQTGTEIGAFIQNEVDVVAGFNVIKGFLNISITDAYWIEQLYQEISSSSFGTFPANGQKVMVEYSSPNTNKPLHLGHIRNNLLGYAVAEILKANGYDVIKANLVNDRGIHICKSMLAWQKFGEGETPESTGMKGDHLVGKYYVRFDRELKAQLSPILSAIYDKKDFTLFNSSEKLKLQTHIGTITYLEAAINKELIVIKLLDFSDFGSRAQILSKSAIDKNIPWKSVLKCFDDEEFENIEEKVIDKKKKDLQRILKHLTDLEEKIQKEKDEIKDVAQNKTQLLIQAQQMLEQWEAGDTEVISLWETMNSWVYAGFAATYKKLGVDFDQYYYESKTYLLGKDIIEEGLAKQVFFKKDDGSVWIDLAADGLDEKLVLRSNGTSVYITQDLGTAQLKYNNYSVDKSIYVVGNEQDYHFKVLFLILQKLGKSWARGLFHLSYGMVDLPSGKMKSREGTVVDADDLMDEMEQTAKTQTEQLGKTADFSEEEKQQLYYTIGMGALKYFLLKVEPKKRLLFDPNESIDFQGHTGPFIQYTHARIKSVLKRAGFNFGAKGTDVKELDAVERDLILTLSQFPEAIMQAARDYSPAIIANYVYDLAKTYNKFYQEKPILKADDEVVKQFRLQLSAATAKIIAKGMRLLGIDVPERM